MTGRAVRDERQARLEARCREEGGGARHGSGHEDADDGRQERNAYRKEAAWHGEQEPGQGEGRKTQVRGGQEPVAGQMDDAIRDAAVRPRAGRALHAGVRSSLSANEAPEIDAAIAGDEEAKPTSATPSMHWRRRGLPRSRRGRCSSIWPAPTPPTRSRRSSGRGAALRRAPARIYQNAKLFAPRRHPLEEAQDNLNLSLEQRRDAGGAIIGASCRPARALDAKARRRMTAIAAPRDARHQVQSERARRRAGFPAGA